MEENKLSRRQLSTIPYLISEHNLETAREKAHIGSATLYRWLKDPHFKHELQRHRQELQKEAIAKLKASLNKATEKLIALMEAPDNLNVQRLAASDLLRHGLKAVELEDLVERLSRIEEIMKTRGML